MAIQIPQTGGRAWGAAGERPGQRGDGLRPEAAAASPALPQMGEPKLLRLAEELAARFLFVCAQVQRPERQRRRKGMGRPKYGPEDLWAIFLLLRIGAHLLRVLPNRRPMDPGWQLPENRLTEFAAFAWIADGGYLGLVPWSLKLPDAEGNLDAAGPGLVVLDQDRGAPLEVDAAAVTPSRTPGRYHIYLPGEEAPVNGHWGLGEAGGEVKAAGGYVLPAGYALLARQLADFYLDRPDCIRFEDLAFDYPAPRPLAPAPPPVPAAVPAAAPRRRSHTAAPDNPFAPVVGQRNEYMFYELRHHGYRMGWRPGGTADYWEELEKVGLQLMKDLPPHERGVPAYTRGEMRASAKSVAKWVNARYASGEWQPQAGRKGSLTDAEFSERQAELGRRGGLASGKVRAKRNIPRNKDICRMAEEGVSKSRIGRLVGLSREWITEIVKRGAAFAAALREVQAERAADGAELLARKRAAQEAAAGAPSVRVLSEARISAPPDKGEPWGRVGVWGNPYSPGWILALPGPPG